MMLLFACLVVGCFVWNSEGQLANSAWPSFGMNSMHTAQSKAYATHEAHLFWKTNANAAIIGSAAIGSDGTVFVGSTNAFLAFTSRGELRWNYTLSGGGTHSTPAIDVNGNVYFGAFDKKVYCLTSSGALKWSYLTGDYIDGSPAIDSHGIIYIGSHDKYLYAFTPAGAVKWKYQLASDIASVPAIGPDGSIYVPCTDNLLWAFYNNGTYQWAYTASQSIGTSVAINNNTIYLPANNNLFAIDFNGKGKWNFPTGSVQASPAIGPDSTIYVGTMSRNLYAVHPNGEEKWKFVCPQADCMFISSPAVGSDGTVYIGSYDGSMYAVTADGVGLWMYNSTGSVHSSPAISAQGTIYYGSDNDYLFAITTECTAGTYITPDGDGFCTDCPLGEYSTETNALVCSHCVYPWTTRFEGQTSCDGVSLFYDTTTTAVVLCALGFMVLICMGVGEQRAAIFINLFFPTLDVFTDLAYLISNDFYSIVLFVFCALSIVIPTGYLFKILYERGAYPRLWWSLDRAFWLEAGGNEEDCFLYPVFPGFESTQGRLPYFSQKEHNSFFAMILECIAWIIAIFAQFATICVIIPGNCLFLVFWLMVGSFLHLTKMLVVGKVWNKWFQIWTLSNDHDTDVDVDTAELIFCLEQEFYIETIPQFIIQLINNLLLERFTTIAAFSMALSIIMSINGVWKFLYHRYFATNKKELHEIQMDMSIGITIPFLNIDWQLFDGKLKTKKKEDPVRDSFCEPMLKAVPDEEQQYEEFQPAVIKAAPAKRYEQPQSLASVVQNQAPPAPVVERNLS